MFYQNIGKDKILFQFDANSSLKKPKFDESWQKFQVRMMLSVIKKNCV